MQDVPEWLEEVASGAVGSNYGPQGGSFASRDTRVSNNWKFLVLMQYMWYHSNSFVVVVAAAGEDAVVVAVADLEMMKKVASEGAGALEVHRLVAARQLLQTTKKNGIRTIKSCLKQPP